MAIHQTILLGCCASLVLGLSLDLPYRIGSPSAHHFGYDSDDLRQDDDFTFEQHTPAAKRKGGGFSPTVLSSYRNDPYWDSYPQLSNFREQVKREAKDNEKQLTEIFKDDETEKKRDKKVPPDTKRIDPSTKKQKKRESKEPDETVPKDKEIQNAPEKENADFHDWLRREYYRNMAKSFASMRRKRDMWGPMDPLEDKVEHVERRSVAPPARAASVSRQKKDVRFEEVTDNLKTIEDALLADALQIIKENGDDYEDSEKLKHRINNDLNAAYDIETMRSALFRLRDTLASMQEDREVDSRQFSLTYKKHKRGDQCPPLRVLTSDCTALGDIVPDESLKELLSHACNWHEVCYTCGEVFGLSSENCDMGFVEQSRTICRGDVPCETTARLLLLPLRQRRVFYKRSNPSVCMVDPCVEEFLSRG